MSFTERRDHRRFTPKEELFADFDRVTMLRNHWRSHRVRDISLSGAFIEDAHPPPGGRQLEIKLWLRASQPLAITSAIRRAEVGQGMGVQFLNMSEDDYDQLRSYIIVSRLQGASVA